MAEVNSLLQLSSLPLAGLERAQLWELEAEGRLIGVVGYERYGEAVLLRSLAVTPAARAQGHGRALLDSALQQAKAEGSRDSYGLTTTIPGWLLRLGFSEISRSELPAELFASEELRGACPADARVFTKALR